MGCPFTHSRVQCPSGTSRDEGQRTLIACPRGVGPGLPAPGALPVPPHPCPPWKPLELPTSELFHGPCQLWALRLGQRENPKQLTPGKESGAPMPGEPAVSRGFQQERGKTEKLQPPASGHVVLLPARASPQPSQLVTKEKHAATLMQLGKCYFSNAARSSGLTL